MKQISTKTEATPDILGVERSKIHFSQSQLNSLRVLVKKKLGIYISHEKDYLLVSKFTKMMEMYNIPTANDLLDRIAKPSIEIETSMARFLTTNHTFFFREASHFRSLCSLVKNSPDGVPRIWCAASSTGEEVYSIMISLLEAGIKSFLIMASDINSVSLKACRAGTYQNTRLADVPDHLLTKYFDKTTVNGENRWSIKKELRDRVLIRRINLLDCGLFEQKFRQFKSEVRINQVV